MKRISLFFLNGSRAFLRSQGGHAAVLFGLMIMPLMGFIGAAVDYSRANSVKAAMQNATDATALALSKNPSLATMSGDQLQSSADSYFRALFKRAEAKNVQVNAPVYTSQSGNYTLSVSATATIRGWGILRPRARLTFPRLRCSWCLPSSRSTRPAARWNRLHKAPQRLRVWPADVRPRFCRCCHL